MKRVLIPESSDDMAGIGAIARGFRFLLPLALIAVCNTAAVNSSAADELTWPTDEPFLKSERLEQHAFKPLFTGDSLEAWDLQPGHKGHWTVRDGVIHYDGKAEQKRSLEKSLWTKRDFGDAVLYVEWNFPDAPTMRPQPIVLFNGDFLLDESGKRVTRPGLDAGDSGILFRGTLDCQANIWCQELGSGEINGYRVNKKLPQHLRRSCIPLIKADRPIGEWNAFLITLNDDRMSVVLNGKQVLHSDPLPDLPDRGPIGLQHHGDTIQFRNIWVRELDGGE